MVESRYRAMIVASETAWNEVEVSGQALHTTKHEKDMRCRSCISYVITNLFQDRCPRRDTVWPIVAFSDSDFRGILIPVRRIFTPASPIV